MATLHAARAGKALGLGGGNPSSVRGVRSSASGVRASEATTGSRTPGGLSGRAELGSGRRCSSSGRHRDAHSSANARRGCDAARAAFALSSRRVVRAGESAGSDCHRRSEGARNQPSSCLRPHPAGRAEVHRGCRGTKACLPRRCVATGRSTGLQLARLNRRSPEWCGARVSRRGSGRSRGPFELAVVAAQGVIRPEALAVCLA